MSSEPILEQSETQEQIVSLPFPSDKRGKELYGLFVVIMPFFAFWATELFKPEWQNGELDSYVILALSSDASLIFFALLAFSIVCYIFLLVDLNRFSQNNVIRFGIYAGVMLALQYSLISGFYFFLDDNSFVFILLLVWALPIAYPKILLWIKAKWDIRIVTRVFIIIWLLGSIWLAITTGTFYSSFLVLLVGLTIAAPFWIFLIYLQTAIWLFKNRKPTLSFAGGLGITVWTATYVVAWRYDILKVFELYAALPTQPPNCYIATAAAQGHPRIVGSQLVHRTDGLSLRVNGQLQHLKCAELALMAVSPRVHGMLRRIYDVVGKFLAQRMTNPFVADVAYLLLKPAEWFAIFVLRWIIPEIETIASEMYSESNVYRRSTQKSVAD